MTSVKKPSKSKYPPVYKLDDYFSFVIFGLVTLAGLGAFGYFSSKALLRSKEVGEWHPIGRLALYEPVLTFHKQFSRWPKNLNEFHNFVSKGNFNISLKPYQKIEFSENKDGSVNISYSFRSVGVPEGGTFTLQKP